MPDYRKKKHRRGYGNKSGHHIRDNKDIVMSPSRSKRQTAKSSIKVVKGKKREHKRRHKFTAAIAVAIVATLCLLSFLLPAGLTENIINALSAIGGGNYPHKLYGGEILQSVSKGYYYYVLTDVELSAFSNTGKEIYSYSHGFSNPVLKTSQTRALIFDQGRNRLDIYNLSKNIFSLDSEQPIITAGISRSGSFAIARKSDTYSSEVTVYNKKGKEIFVWNSAKDTVNNVAISPSGKKIAVSTVSAQAGSLVSKIMVFTFDSANPVFSYELIGETVYSIENTNKGFMVLTGGGCSYITWSKYKRTDIKNELNLDRFSAYKHGNALVFNRDSDKSDNTIVVISSRGKEISEFKFNGIISDVHFAKGHIYCISDSKVYIYDKQGELLRTGDCGYGCRRMAVIGSHSIAAIYDNEVKKIDILD